MKRIVHVGEWCVGRFVVEVGLFGGSGDSKNQSEATVLSTLFLCSQPAALGKNRRSESTVLTRY